MKDYNKIFFEFLHGFPGFEDITYENGIVSYQGQTTDVSKIYLLDLVKSEKSAFKMYIHELDAGDVFRIIDLHTKRIHDQYNEHDEDQSDIVISPNQYIKYINKSNISDEENKKIQDFETLVYQCFKYQDYLLEEKRLFLSKYQRKINEIEEKEKYADLTDADKHAKEKFYSIHNSVIAYLNEKARKRIQESNNFGRAAGFADAFIVILSTIATGIIVGIVLYFTLF